jgi:hypothetical protein
MAVTFLTYVLYHTRYRAQFRVYCRSAYVENNLDFFEAVEEYHARPDKKKAIKIIKDFIENAGVTTGEEKKGPEEEKKAPGKLVVTIPITVSPAIVTKLLGTLKDYETKRDDARKMNPLTRALTSADRKADVNIFEDAEKQAIRDLGMAAGNWARDNDNGKEAFRKWQVQGDRLTDDLARKLYTTMRLGMADEYLP